MSETVARQRPTVDLDDFERRLREAQAAPQQGQGSQHDGSRGYDDDPLAELARLVGERHDPYGDVFAQEAAPHQAPAGGRLEPALGTASPSPRFSADFAAIEAGLRGALAVHPELPTTAADQQAHEAHPHAPQLYAEQEQAYSDPSYAGEQDWAVPGQHKASGGRSRRPIYAMVATIAVGVIGIGVAFAYKGASSSPREIKTIMAAAGPTKIQPPADSAAGQDGQDAGALDKSQAAPTKLVSREEQPVDLSQAVQDNAARDGMSHGTDASSVPVPLSPGQARDGASSADGAALGGAAAAPDANGEAFGAGMPAPKKVKVVSVRPDGSIMPTNDSQSASVESNAAPPPTPVAPPVPTKPAKALKSTSRVTATKPTTTVSPADDGDTAPPAKPAKATKKPKPQRVASAETEDKAVPTDQAAPEQAATDAAEPKVGGGGFAVQLAAPGSEAEAKAATSRLGKKFADALSGHHLGFRKADSNGRSVYRVRVGSLSREDASGLCEKVKAEGGTCFVAKN